jgi:hypothetical protein
MPRPAPNPRRLRAGRGSSCLVPPPAPGRWPTDRSKWSLFHISWMVYTYRNIWRGLATVPRPAPKVNEKIHCTRMYGDLSFLRSRKSMFQVTPWCIFYQKLRSGFAACCKKWLAVQSGLVWRFAFCYRSKWSMFQFVWWCIFYQKLRGGFVTAPTEAILCYLMMNILS